MKILRLNGGTSTGTRWNEVEQTGTDMYFHYNISIIVSLYDAYDFCKNRLFRFLLAVFSFFRPNSRLRALEQKTGLISLE